MDQSAAGEPVQVFVRIRPEDVPNTNVTVTVLDNMKTLRLTPPDGTFNSRKSVSAVDDKVFTYDEVLDENCSQEQVYTKVCQHARAVIRGYNTTIFAYGSTGSGKSHTMTGTSAQPGIIPRVVSEIFSIIEATTAVDKDVLFYVRISYVELYNNNFRNLLDGAMKDVPLRESRGSLLDVIDQASINTAQQRRSSVASAANSASFDTTLRAPNSPVRNASAANEKIEVRESQSAGVFLSGPNLRIPVTSAQETYHLISRGNKLRAVGSTNCNDMSSRSHAILTIHVESRVPYKSEANSPIPNAVTPTSSVAQLFNTVTGEAVPDSSLSNAELRLGKMHLVDLAGSERLAMSGAEGETLVETQNINLSLTALGKVLLE